MFEIACAACYEVAALLAKGYHAGLVLAESLNDPMQSADFLH